MTAAPGREKLLNWAAGEVGRVDAELLACHVLGCRRVDLYLGTLELPPEFEELVRRRVAGEPLQYLTGVQAFRGIEVRVGPGVLVPRPETELLVEKALEVLPPVGVAVDAGTGSGAIALSLAVERPDLKVWATELSPEARRWSEANLAGVPNVRLVSGDLLSSLPAELKGSVDLVVSNPPYLSEHEWFMAPEDVREHEPREALTCGDDGFAATAGLIDESLSWLKPGGWLVFETSPALAGRARRAMSEGYRDVEIIQDLAGRPRIVKGRRP